MMDHQTLISIALQISTRCQDNWLIPRSFWGMAVLFLSLNYARNYVDVCFIFNTGIFHFCKHHVLLWFGLHTKSTDLCFVCFTRQVLADSRDSTEELVGISSNNARHVHIHAWYSNTTANDILVNNTITRCIALNYCPLMVR